MFLTGQKLKVYIYNATSETSLASPVHFLKSLHTDTQTNTHSIIDIDMLSAGINNSEPK